MNTRTTASNLVNRLESLGFRLWEDGGRLRFDGPAGVLTPDLRNELSANKAEVLALLGAPRVDSTRVIRRVPRNDPLPLSFAQERLWFLDRLTPDSAAYSVLVALRLEGELDVASLSASLDTVVARHESLRTTFDERDGEPVQVIAPSLAIALVQIDLSGLERRAREKAVRRLANEEAAHQFDLTRGPLLRTRLLALGAHEHVLLLTMHHVVADGWSLGVLFQDLARDYAAKLRGEGSPLAPLPVQYADFAAWQRNWLEGAELSRQLAYWRRHLSEMPVLELPTDRQRPAVQRFTGAAYTHRLPLSLAGELRELGRAEGVSLFMLLLAGFALLLERVSGQDDVVVGTPIANRNRTELEELIGFFVNTLVMRVDLSGQPTVRELLGRVRETALEAYAHQDLPFEKLVEALKPERDLSRNPLVQVSFALQNMPLEQLALEGLSVSQVARDTRQTHLDLDVYVWESPKGLVVVTTYDTDLFDTATVRRLLGHYERVLQELVRAPDAPVTQLALLGDDERAELDAWNATTMAFPREATLHGLFAAQVARTPQAVAVQCDGVSISYADLDTASGALARRLHAHGVEAQAPVAVYLERSLELVVAVLAVLKAGAVYVPLDPGDPRERVRFIVQDSGAALLLTQGNLQAALPAMDVKLLRIDEPTPHSEIDADAAEVAVEVNGDALAYVIYTSGSTGEPKGVMGLHRGLVNRLHWMWQRYPYAPAERCCHKTTMSFVDALAELFSPLLAGVPLVFSTRSQARDPQELARLVGQERITRLLVVPSLLRALLELDETERAALAVVGVWVCSGEALDPALEKRLHECFPEAVLINLYGASEVSADVTCFDTRERGDTHGSLIGRPIANTRIYVLDAHQRRVPVGVPGELWVGGEGLARGYLHRPELTDERFVPDPFAEHKGAQPDERLYRTGDRARWRADGVLEYLGRLDNQVKIRGHRVELGEIESVLSRHEVVRQCVVVCSCDEPGDEQLVAYVIARTSGTDAEVLGAQLRDHLRARLPVYMVPAAFVMLDTLPLGPSGKLDRAALPAPHRAPVAGAVAPSGPAEKAVAAIWCELLNIEAVGAHDSFFDLGGHSLKATQMVSRLRHALGVEFTLADIFDDPTVAGIVARAAVRRDDDADAPDPGIVPVPRDAPLPLSFAQERLWFLDRLTPDSAAYNEAMAVRLNGELDVAALSASLDTVVARHESLRTTFDERDGEPVQVIAPSLAIALVQIDLSGLERRAREKAVRRLANEEAAHQFDLTRGPLLRTRLLALGAHEHVLLLTMHHVVADGWSFGLLFHELGVLYEALRAGRPSPLSALPVQYADFAAWQRNWLEGAELSRQLAYWRRHLSEMPVLELPTDRQRPAVQRFTGAAYTHRLPLSLAGELRELGRAEGVSLFMLLLAGFALLLERVSGQDDVVVGTPIANRNRTELEELIGFFVNTLVMRVDLSGQPTVRELLGRVRETALEAYAHQDLPFEKLVEALKPERDLSRNPLVQVSFALQNMPLEQLALEGLSVSQVARDTRQTHLDLDVYVWESPKGLVVVTTYDTDLFDTATVRRLLGHYERVLQELVRAPDAPVTQLALLGDDERAELDAWNATTMAFPREATLHGLFAAQVARTPQAVAVQCDGVSISYADLDTASGALARRLHAHGVEAQAPVAVYLERSLELVVAVLAVLKAGAVYVPLDPGDPRERVRFIVQDSGAALLLTQGNLQAALPAMDVKLLRIDEPTPHSEIDADAAEVAVEVNGDALAYVIYTSGSTGEPKGVMGLHRGLVNRLHWMWQRYPYAPAERCCHKTTMSFVDALAELFSPLLAGVPLVFSTRSQARDPQELARLVGQERITRLLVVPSLLRALLELDETERAALAVVGVWVCSGEALDPALEKRLHECFPEAVLINLYGASEVSADVTCFDTRERGDTHGSLIGRPIANTRIYVLDAHQRRVPVGVPGELWVGGEGLARGYLHRPELTDERFVPDPFAEHKGAQPDERLYRTGDRARWRADGVLEYLGRLDNQVKIRGHRVELGEIESVLSRHEVVRQCVVVCSCDEPGDEQLVAYVIARTSGTDAEVLGAQLRDHLRARLPVYMVPAAFVMLDTLPLGPSGKLDRAALPAPHRAPVAGAVAPSGPAEKAVAAIWCELLNIEAVGAHDSFFDLGGHSLKATQMVSRLRHALGVEFTLADIFDDPTVAGIVARAAVRRDDDADAPDPGIVPVPRDAPLPLSFAQERLWFLDQMVPGNSAYHVPFAISLRGPLQRAALHQALQALVARHEVLHTIFIAQDGVPRQVIKPEMTLDMPVTGSGGASGAPADAVDLHALMREEFDRPFDLARGPLLRARLVVLDIREHVLLLTVHHAVTDGWSSGVLLRELGVVYEAFRDGRPSPLSALPVQYVDFAVWQRQRLSGVYLEREIDYWREQLSGLTPLELPTDRGRPLVQGFRGARESMRVPTALADALVGLGRRDGATEFMTLLCIFTVLLHRYSGQQQIAVGSPIAARNREEIEGVIGFFVNMLVMRARVNPHSSFRTLLAQVRATALGAYQHQDLPFEKLVEELVGERDPSRNPLFQVSFALQNAPFAPLELANLELDAMPIQAHATRFDLEAHAWRDNNGLGINFIYNTDLFDAATVRRMLGHYQNLLEAVVLDPESPVAELKLLTQAERAQVMESFNATSVDYPRDASLAELFAVQARATPDAVALEFAGATLSYAELDVRANRLAHRLRALGVGHETRVAVCLPRSLELVVTIIATVKAGGAYVPLDPEYPPARLALMLEDSAAAVLLTVEALRERLPPTTATVLCLDNLSLDGEPDNAPPSLAGARSLAYLMYTSGSTGVPKGTCIEHRSVVRLVKSANYLQMEPSQRWLQLAPISFDASTLELWGSLLNGGQLVVFAPHTPTFEELGRCLIEQRIDVLWLTAALFHRMVDEQPEALASVRQLLAGGEALSPPHVERMLARLAPGARLVNGYGPTENTTFTCCHVMRAGDAVHHHVPIGRPISNTTVYVLDERRAPVPVGVPGELYIGGDGLAREYWQRPELTAEKFVPDPFADEAGARLYRTGDRVRWRDDGVLEFLGRLDDQVKLRGFRIEPGEVEAVIAQHPDVRQCVVVCREDETGEQRLVGYVVAQTPADDSDELIARLREHAAAQLPGHMLPSALVILDALPISPNGKLDRSALPSPDYATAEIALAPRSKAEEVLALIWAELLALKDVGVQQNFFELGGHSLLATQMVSRVREQLGVELSLAQIFDAPTVAGIAALFDAQGQAIANSSAAAPLSDSVAAIVPIPRGGPMPLSFAQERLWFLDQMVPNNPAYHMPLALDLRGDLDVESLHQSLQALVARHESLRTVFTSKDGTPHQVVLPRLELKLTRESLTTLPAAQRQQMLLTLMHEEFERPFDLARGPLLRARLVDAGLKQHVLLLTLHHVVSDGWSTGVLFHELGSLYEAFRAGRPSPLAPLPVQYADFAAWQRKWLSGPRLREQRDYWRKQLDGVTPLRLLTDRVRPAIQSFAGAHESLQVPPALAASLEDLCNRESATLFMALLAGFVVVMRHYSGQDDIAVGSPIANRNRAEIEGLIGGFVNMLVLRTQVEPRASFRELLAQVRETALGAYQHQDLPFEKLVDDLADDRDLSRNPLFQVSFSLHNEPLPELKLAGLELGLVPAPAMATRFDLEAHAWVDARGLGIDFIYNTDLFEASTVRHMLSHYQQVLKSVAAAPERALGEVELLTQTERVQVVESFNATAVDYPREASLGELFAAQARTTPDAVALEFAGATLSYAELDVRANRLAHRLRALGVGHETRVAVCLPRSLELVVTIIATVKAGGAYVPLDPEYPPARLALMLEDSAAAVLLTVEALRERLPPTTATVLCLDNLSLDGEPDNAPPSLAGARSLAYLMYTSGSTGVPKGTCIEHRSVVRLVKSANYLQMEPSQRWLQLAPISFDASTLELWGSLLNGGQLVVFAPHTPTFEELGRCLIEQRIDVLWLTAALFHRMVDEQPEALASVRQLLAGGEALSPPHVERMLARLAPGARLVNGYGPTENTTFTCCHVMRAGDAVHHHVPIGRPISNTTVYVLDERRAPVPVGVPGELYIGGDGLAREYWQRPELTAEKFVSDPFADEAGARLYRTGDRVRWRDDGVLEFLGRLDDQVKLRGFRIEPGEVEAVIAQHPDVRQCVVVCREDSPGEKRIVAYVEPKAGAEHDLAQALGRHAGTWLPSYMLPTACVLLDALPLNPNGKVDLNALPAPDMGVGAEPVVPRNPTEEAIADIWCDILRLEQVSVHQNFFELGGHSLIATQVLSRLRERFAVELRLTRFMEHPTVAELALCVQALEHDTPPPTTPSHTQRVGGKL